MVNSRLPIIKLLKVCLDAAQAKALCARLLDFADYLKQWTTNKLEGFRVVSTPSPQVQVISDPRDDTPTLTEAWNDFVAWKSWTARRTDENQRVFDNLNFFLGDAPVGRVEKSDLKRALASIALLPARNKSPYNRMSMADIAKMEVPEEDRISSKSVKEHLKVAQGLFNAYLVREVDVLKHSPTEGLRLEVEDNRYASMPDSTVKKVIGAAKNKPEWFRWMLLIAVYSGARRSEIAALRASDFKLCEDTDRYYFVIRKGKTIAAKRLVPVHRKLLEEGLIEWIGDGDMQLFPEALDNLNRVTHLFNSVLEDNKTDLGERIVFHSTRHTFISKARSQGVSTPLVQQTVGHEKTGAGMTDRYTHTFPLSDLLVVVDSISY